VAGARGASVTWPAEPDLLFGEGAGRFVASVPPSKYRALQALARERGVSLRPLGRVEGDRLRIASPGAGTVAVDLPLEAMSAAWTSLEV
jgi:hypothetical protein